MINADVIITHKTSPPYLYQTIRIIPNKRSNLRYFLMDKYEACRQLDDLLSNYYLGNGENIFFKEKQKFKSSIIIKYEAEDGVEVELKNKKFRIQAEEPPFDGCIFCKHLRKSSKGKDRCSYYKIFLNKHKIFCSDFDEKG